jgi:hypothetical protein
MCEELYIEEDSPIFYIQREEGSDNSDYRGGRHKSLFGWR